MSSAAVHFDALNDEKSRPNAVRTPRLEGLSRKWGRDGKRRLCNFDPGKHPNSLPMKALDWVPYILAAIRMEATTVGLIIGVSA